MGGPLSKVILLFYRVFGIFPAINFNEESGEMKFSTKVFLYNLTSVAISACIFLYSFIWDFENTKKKFPTALADLCIVINIIIIITLVLSTTVFVISSGKNCSKLIGLYYDLHMIDNNLKVIPEETKFQSYIPLSLIYITAFIILELVMKTVLKTMDPQYLAFIFMIYISQAAQLQYTGVVDNIHRRFLLINERIKDEVNHERFRSLLRLSSQSEVQHLFEFQNAAAFHPLGIQLLSEMHWALCKTVDKTNSIFCWQLLALLLSLILQAIMTPYALYLAWKLGDKPEENMMDLRHKWVLVKWVFWTINHVVRLVLLVYPCAATNKEANQTAPIVCRLLNREMNLNMKKQLEKFVLQLLHHKPKFSVFGLFHLELPILMSIAGAVTTYLLILVQFQNDVNED